MMRRTRFIIFALCLYGAVGASGAAVAAIVPAMLDIDFRDASFSVCNSTAGCTVGGITVTPSPTSPGLFWASDDGFGVRGHGGANQIAKSKTLTIEFDTAVTLTGV